MMLTSGLFDGLYPAERVLMVLGIVLFFVLIGLVIYSVVKGQSITALLGAFLFPIAMIGYSHLQSISYDNGVAKLNFATQQLQDDPTNASKRTQLDQALQQVAPRVTSAGSPEAVAVVANGQFAAGETGQAQATLNQAAALNPDAPAVVQLRHKIDTLNRLQMLTEQVQTAPANTAARRQLDGVLAQASTLKLANPAAIAQVAKAQMVTGQTAVAAQTASVALRIQPNQPLATAVHQRILAAH